MRTGPATARGLALSFERGNTSKERLKIDWRHPVPPASKEQHTAAAGALPLADALDVLWENDERPLLVLRECSLCQDSDQALLSRSLNNDKTMLLTKWFRVVRLPAHVTEPTHPFHNVFAGYDFPQAPHFFLLADKNSKPVQFTGMQTPQSLWKGMLSVLRERYTKDPEKAVKNWLLVLDQFDRFDASMRSLQEELDATRAKDGPESPKAKELYKRLDEARAQRAETLAREERIRDLGLAPMVAAAVK
jgi:hypothetical protein